MLPEVRPHVSGPLADQLQHQLGLASDLEARHLDVERVAGIAVVAAAHSGGYAAIGHLLGLLAALPAPTGAGERFWLQLWRSSGTAYLLPANMKAEVLQSMAGEGTALARQILSAVDEMTPPQRVAAGEAIGQALAESDHLPDLKTQVIGELWLRDLELTAWHVLHADRRADDPAGRKAFLEAWTSA
ncbi:hypothetical protein ABZ532_31325 [Streptomyces sp. NPDC019396]|uniref:hypothetical protein n=1 Tax=Streptomyces sp. NPDC019396 TaxID=3154687 RepID=UPI0033DCFB51